MEIKLTDMTENFRRRYDDSSLDQVESVLAKYKLTAQQLYESAVERRRKLEKLLEELDA